MIQVIEFEFSCMCIWYFPSLFQVQFWGIKIFCLGVVAYAFNPSNGEVGAGEWEIQGIYSYPVLKSKQKS